MLGKLLLKLGPDRILWGTDSVINGVPQAQIAAFRMFQIPEAMQAEFGYPAITAEVRAKIFGLNAARVYAVDPELNRYAIAGDDVDQLRTAFLSEPGLVPLPHPERYEGPRTRRAFFERRAREQRDELMLRPRSHRT